MGLKRHLLARLALLAAGFFGGAMLHSLLFAHSRGIGPLLFFVLPIVGGLGLPFVFAHLVPARCPRCRGRAGPRGNNPTLYVCRECGTQTHALESADELAPAPVPAPGEVPRERPAGWRRIFWLFVLLGVMSVVVGAMFAADSIRLLRDGVSSDARVLKVATNPGITGHRGTTYTAHIEYRAGNAPALLLRSWSVRDRGSCMWPCYAAGEQLKVIYLPDAPGTAKVYSFSELFFEPLIFAFPGLVFALVGGFFARRR